MRFNLNVFEIGRAEKEGVELFRYAVRCGVCQNAGEGAEDQQESIRAGDQYVFRSNTL